MHLSQILKFVNIVIMAVLIIVIALQNKSAGLSNVFGSAGNIVQTRRGFEKWLFYATIILRLIFMAINVGSLFIK